MTPRLTERQQDVLDLLLQGREQKEIGRLLDISHKTVNTHVSAIYNAFSVSNHPRLILRAFRLGLLASVAEDAASNPDGQSSERLTAQSELTSAPSPASAHAPADSVSPSAVDRVSHSAIRQQSAGQASVHFDGGAASSRKREATTAAEPNSRASVND